MNATEFLDAIETALAARAALAEIRMSRGIDGETFPAMLAAHRRRERGDPEADKVIAEIEARAAAKVRDAERAVDAAKERVARALETALETGMGRSITPAPTPPSAPAATTTERTRDSAP